MTNEEILEAQKLIASIREDLSILTGTTDKGKLPALVLEKTESMRRGFAQLLRLSVLNGVDWDEASYGWMAMKAAAQLAQDRPDFKGELTVILAKGAPRVEAVLDKTAQALTEKAAKTE